MNFLMACLASLSFLGAANPQFVNQENGFVVVEQKDNKVIFHDPILEVEMIESGVVIPPEHQERYGQKERIKFGEEGFFEAFKEFYSVYIYDPNVYRWV